MQPSIELALERRIDTTVHLHTAEAGESRRLHPDAVMRLATGSGTGMASMLMRLIDHLQQGGLEDLPESGVDPRLA